MVKSSLPRNQSVTAAQLCESTSSGTSWWKVDSACSSTGDEGLRRGLATNSTTAAAAAIATVKMRG